MDYLPGTYYLKKLIVNQRAELFMESMRSLSCSQD